MNKLKRVHITSVLKSFSSSKTLVLAMLLIALPSQATTYNITALIPYENGNDSSVHGAMLQWQTWQPLRFGSIASATGTYDDTNGTLDATFTVTLRDKFVTASEERGIMGDTRTVHLNVSNFSFGAPDANGVALAQTDATGTLDLTGGAVYRALHNEIMVPDAVYDISFLAQQYYPSANGGPNTLTDLVQGVRLLDLWGDGFLQGSSEFIAGADFRLELTAVPLPAAVFLFGSALLGLFGVRMRKQNLNEATS